MSTKPDWQALADQTRNISPEAIKATTVWFDAHPDWTWDMYFMNYPPRIYARFCLHGVNIISDRKMSEIGELATNLCNTFGLLGKKYVHSNTVEYKFHLPIKE